MNEPGNIGVMVAFAAGLLSFLSPCVLPLVPSYLGFLTGMTLEQMTDRKRLAFWHALAFVIGFSVVFIVMGAGATVLGATLTWHKQTIARIGGALIIVFGLYTMGVFRVGVLDRERRLHLENKPVGFLGSSLVGMTFAAGWTPCLGPILAAILGLAGSTGDLNRGLLLLSAYSVGLAVPFLLAALAVDRFRDWFTRFRPWMIWVQRLSGLVLILVGVLLVTGEFSRLAAWLQSFTPEWILERV